MGCIPQKSYFTKPKYSVLRAAVQLGYIDNTIACVGHRLDHLPHSVFAILPTYQCFEEKDVGFADQFGSSCEDLQIKAFSVDFDHIGQRRVACSNDLVESGYRNFDLAHPGGLLRCRSESTSVVAAKN